MKTYQVRHFSDVEMTCEIASTRPVLNWNEAWDAMHCHKREVPEGLRVSVIEEVDRFGVTQRDKYYRNAKDAVAAKQ